MPACSNCSWRNGETCRARELALVELKRPLPPAPSGACTVAIVDSYLSLVRPGMRVLEIGCGTWAKLRDHCVAVGAHYEGLDVQTEYYGIPSIATRIGNLATLDFADEDFDLVIGNQTMEHWAEHGCTLDWGLKQCFRVTRPGGMVCMNVPVHLHGTREFVHGEIDTIENRFRRFSTRVELERWGSPTAPLPPYYAHPRFGALRDRPAWVLDIRAVRDRPLPTNVTNTMGFDGRLARLFHYSARYNAYLLRQKIENAFGP
jgi:SAM-dependent methyltransferase